MTAVGWDGAGGEPAFAYVANIETYLYTQAGLNSAESLSRD
ncbi:MAG: hypothetical protein ACRC14_05715 [Paracoccaceae bacterium]